MDKNLEGKVIYAIPTGNNARRGNRIVQFKVKKVKRKYIELAIMFDGEESRIVDNYCPDSGSTQSAISTGYGGNAGYRFFIEEESAKNFIERNKLSEKIIEYIRENRRSLTLEKCRKIKDILGIDNE